MVDDAAGNNELGRRLLVESGARVEEVPTEAPFVARSRSGFEIDLQTRDGTTATPITKSCLDGHIRFVPGVGDKSSNVIAVTQIVMLLDARPARPAPTSRPARCRPVARRAAR